MLYYIWGHVYGQGLFEICEICVQACVEALQTLGIAKPHRTCRTNTSCNCVFLKQNKHSHNRGVADIEDHYAVQHKKNKAAIATEHGHANPFLHEQNKHSRRRGVTKVENRNATEHGKRKTK